MPFTFLGELQRKVRHFISQRSFLPLICGAVPVQPIGVRLLFLLPLSSPRTPVNFWTGYRATRVRVQHVSSDG